MIWFDSGQNLLNKNNYGCGDWDEANNIYGTCDGDGVGDAGLQDLTYRHVGDGYGVCLWSSTAYGDGVGDGHCYGYGYGFGVRGVIKRGNGKGNGNINHIEADIWQRRAQINPEGSGEGFGEGI